MLKVIFWDGESISSFHAVLFSGGMEGITNYLTLL